MSEWPRGSLNDVLIEVNDRNNAETVELVLSVTERRGIVPQTEVFRKRIATNDTAKYKVVQPLDIAWNPYLLWTGAVGQWLGSEPGVTSPVYPIFRARDNQVARFWGLVLESGILTPYFDSTAIGSIQRRRRTTVPVFKASSVRIPSHYEQRRIVEVMSIVDAHIEALDAESLSVNRAYSALLNELSQSHTLRPIRDVVLSAQAGGTPSRNRPDFYGGDIPWLKSGEVDDDEIETASEFITESGLKGSAAKVVPPGSTVVAMYGQGDTKGRAGFIRNPVATNQAVLALVPDKTQVHPRLLLHAVRSQTVALRARAIGAAQPNLSKGLVTSHLIPIPDDLEFQQVFADAADSLTREGGKLIGELYNLRTFRSSLLRALLNQEIEIPGSYDAFLEGAS
ncbi:restriction endonuclease subunit S [Glutamicibacter protophormiae]|uniref:restriction endonuclease subunit S n=1 Tax=Glutamicibacter protophormiae TaxID=37930 RepID=UPI00332DC17C